MTTTNTTTTAIGYRNEEVSSNPHLAPYTLREVIDFETEELCNTDIFDYMQDKLPSEANTDTIIDYLTTTLSVPENELHYLWLTDTPEQVATYYPSGYDNNEPTYITEYQVTNPLVISDLGEDGKLYVSAYPIVEKDTQEFLN